jgi:hypothetical protein
MRKSDLGGLEEGMKNIDGPPIKKSMAANNLLKLFWLWWNVALEKWDSRNF